MNNEIYIYLQSEKRIKNNVDKQERLSTMKKVRKCRKINLSTKLSTISTVENKRKKLEMIIDTKHLFCAFF